MIDPDVLFGVLLTFSFIWTFFCLLITGHYFVATVIDSAAGTDVTFTADNVLDRLWRMGLCVWIVVFWVLLGSFLLGPLLAGVPMMFFGIMAVLLWVLFPLSLLSVLYTQNWIFMLHPKLVWQQLQHGSALAYVHGVTGLLAILGGVLVALVVQHSFYWAMPAAFILPAIILLYARLWGQFAWLVLYSERPRKAKKNARERGQEEKRLAALEDAAIPEVDVEEFNPAEAVREGLPPTFPGMIHASTSTEPETIPLTMPAAASTSALPVTMAVEEEDEFAKDKKPYTVIEPPSPGLDDNLTISIADSKPSPLSDYYDEKYREEQERKKREEKASNRFLPLQRGEPPTFQTALVRGVWGWIIEPATLAPWAVLIAMTVVELFFITMVVRNWPDNNNG